MQFRYVIKALALLWVVISSLSTHALAVANVVTQQQPVIAVNSVVHLNQATLEELLSLKGIGRKRAQAIVDYREAHGPFISIEQLTDVPGISSRVLEQNRDRLAL